MFQTVKGSAISLKPLKWQKASNAEKLEAFFVAAAAEAPALIVAPEGVLEGYVVMDVIEGRATPEAMLAIAEPLDGPYIQRFRNLARSLKTCLCFGFAERRGADSVYNSAVFIDSRGDISGTYHKTQLAEGTHPTWNFNCIGETIRAFDTPFGRAGILICNDRWNPLIARTLVLDGAQFLVIPSYGSKGKAQNRAVLARARENGVPIVEANVGMNLIISKGEIAAYQWGNDQISTADIHIPAPPSTEAARRSEQEYLSTQGREMEARYRKTIARLT